MQFLKQKRWHVTVVLLCLTIGLGGGALWISTDKPNQSERDRLVKLLDEQAREDPKVVVETFMWAVAHDDKELLKRTIDVEQLWADFDTSWVWVWKPISIELSPEYKDENYCYSYRHANVRFLKISKFPKPGPLIKVFRNSGVFRGWMTCLLKKQTPDSPWLITSIGI